MGRSVLWAVLFGMLASFAQGAQTRSGVAPESDAQPGGATDYSQVAHWVCRPGAESICETGLDATVLYADGHRDALPFTPAAHPSIDCFYVYPTVSREPVPYSDLTDSPEIQKVVNAQVGRLSSRCRVFAPLYRQATLWHLLRRGAGNPLADSNVPTLDVQAAWAYYLEHDNQGRGVVLIGHSQGTILLQSLIAQEIDGKPSQSLLVAAFLAGDPSLGVPHGKAVGGTFGHIPTCSAAAQTGCVYAWGSYLADNDASQRLFGRVRADGWDSACVNPAAPGGGSGSLKFYELNPLAVASGDPPWVERLGQVSGGCRADSEGNVFRVAVEPGAFEKEVAGELKRSEALPKWGLHVRDIALVQGNILDVMDAEIAAWGKRH